MDRRKMIGGLAASAVSGMAAVPPSSGRNNYLELTVWQMHNSAENQETRVSTFLSGGLTPALERSGSKLIGAFGNVMGGNGPYYVTLAQFASLAAYEQAAEALRNDEAYAAAMKQLSSGPRLPFVRMESSLLRCFDAMPQPAVGDGEVHGRIFELRTYESQGLAEARRKVEMFNDGEAHIFMRLGFRPVFFGETVIGPRQPNLMYMLSYDNLAQHDRLWGKFGNDPEWQKLRSRPGLSDAEIVANISNVILRPLGFSGIR